MISYLAHATIHLVNCSLLLSSIVIGFFVKADFKQFMKHNTARTTTVYTQKLTLACNIVLCEILADLFVLISPTIVLCVLKYGFSTDLAQTVGPVALPLFSLYVLICAASYAYLTYTRSRKIG
ncbi:hypothetical protein QR680_010138 [Steinernema hermaphroditum]|uniref:7TM GPCR serpentine receptor class x (Srx) domain-containing protein n=1 Tax=Steinernema hermaphroditum TaxID=289476 RepID=A0AA39IPJ5_9BILA|nr:hypothetical protein QR680_010138 [Steinernema hermaphroditum]